MLEIDEVRSAIEDGAAFERCDDLSDEYYTVIEMATRPSLSEAEQRALYARIEHLQVNGDFIGRLLAKRDDQLMLIHGNDVQTVSGAYMSALEQVKNMAGYEMELA